MHNALPYIHFVGRGGLNTQDQTGHMHQFGIGLNRTGHEHQHAIELKQIDYLPSQSPCDFPSNFIHEEYSSLLFYGFTDRSFILEMTRELEGHLPLSCHSNMSLK